MEPPAPPPHPPPHPHTEGVALMLAPEVYAALIGWEPVNSHIIKFTTKKKDIRLNIIQCYAPTNDAEEEKKDDFYQQLQAVFDRRRAKDITILMEDFNAKIGMDNTGYEDIIGTHGLGQMNENGKRFADLCATQHKEWISAVTIHKQERRRERKIVLNDSQTRAAKAKAVNREVKRSIKKDKRDYIDDQARQAETAAGQAEGPVAGDQEAYGHIPEDRQASEGQEWEPANNNLGTVETVGRPL